MKVTLAPGIESISGSMKSKNGVRIVYKTYTKPSIKRPGGKPETRAYFVPESSYQRRTPISQKEIANRSKFRDASMYWLNLSDKLKKSYYDEWKRSKYMFNGKKYKTLRGYVIARYFAGAIAG